MSGGLVLAGLLMGYKPLDNVGIMFAAPLAVLAHHGCSLFRFARSKKQVSINGPDFFVLSDFG